MKIINRISAILLATLTLVYLLTGYILRHPVKLENLSPYLFNVKIAVNVHLGGWLDLILLPLLLFHALTSLRFIIVKSEKVEFRMIDLAFIAVGLALLAFLLYLRY
ncbi:MAG: hypothetical protein M1371_04005 [Actinobacteria bacterium]|nr:hypothetical protein [Actinomycetota bacterium]